MPVAHYCPNCGKFSQHNGVFEWAVTCPQCGETGPAHRHTPGRAALEAARQRWAAQQEADAGGDAPVVARGTLDVDSTS